MNLYTVPLSRTVKQLLLMLADGVMLALALWLSCALLGISLLTRENSAYLFFALPNIASVLVFLRIGLYRAILLYMGLQSGFIVLQGVTIIFADRFR
jgi:FlaA1/EpsC-like NDP-sugar epimerase